MGMMKNYLLGLLTLCSEEQFGQDAIEWAITTGFIHLSYDREEDLRLIMGEPGQPDTGKYSEIESRSTPLASPSCARSLRALHQTRRPVCRRSSRRPILSQVRGSDCSRRQNPPFHQTLLALFPMRPCRTHHPRLMKLTCVEYPNGWRVFEDGQIPIATFASEEYARRFCNADLLLRRAHDMLCGVVSDTFADVSDIIGDIRVALDLQVTDCDNCRQCIAVAEAVQRNGETLCRDCAEIQDTL